MTNSTEPGKAVAGPGPGSLPTVSNTLVQKCGSPGKLTLKWGKHLEARSVPGRQLLLLAPAGGRGIPLCQPQVCSGTQQASPGCLFHTRPWDTTVYMSSWRCFAQFWAYSKCPDLQGVTSLFPLSCCRCCDLSSESPEQGQSPSLDSLDLGADQGGLGKPPTHPCLNISGPGVTTHRHLSW